MLRRVLYETILIILVAIILSLGSYFARPEALTKNKVGNVATSSEDQSRFFGPVSIEIAKTLHAENLAIFADARPPADYAQGHISDAINLDPFNFDQWSGELVTANSPQQIFITYCDDANCPLARQLAEKLSWLGFEKVYYLEDGWSKWKERNLPAFEAD